jgi:endonuclease-3
VKPAKGRAIFARLAERTPNPRTELDYGTPFQLLVAVVLSAQSTDKGVNKVTQVLFRDAPTAQAIAALGATGLQPYLASLGLFRMKAKHVAALAGAIVREHGGEVPRERDALEALPGVGRKTASVVLNTAFGQPTIAVDTHIFRVANRSGLAHGKTVVDVERGLVAITPPEYVQDAHHWLILHGRYTCVARKPKCPECPIRDLCEYPHKTPAAEAPTPRATRPARPRTAAPAVQTKQGPVTPARGAQPFAKTARAGAKRGRSR